MYGEKCSVLLPQKESRKAKKWESPGIFCYWILQQNRQDLGYKWNFLMLFRIAYNQKGLSGARRARSIPVAPVFPHGALQQRKLKRLCCPRRGIRAERGQRLGCCSPGDAAAETGRSKASEPRGRAGTGRLLPRRRLGRARAAAPRRGGTRSPSQRAPPGLARGGSGGRHLGRVSRAPPSTVQAGGRAAARHPCPRAVP